MIDSLSAEHVERLPDVVGRPFLAGMRGEKETGIACAAEDAGEFLGRMAELGRIESDADEFMAVRQRLIERALGIGLVEMAEEAQDEVRLDAELRRGIICSAV